MQDSTPCINPSLRRPWQILSDGEKRSYLDAQLCVMRTPQTLGLPGARTRFEELAATHQIGARASHATGTFSPTIDTYCMPMKPPEEEPIMGDYWDETREAGNFIKSTIFESGLGFGGFGSDLKGCIEDGPFANLTNALASPGDPVFYVHHAWVDKIWWDWQEADLDNRMYAIGGPSFQSPDIGFPEVPGIIPDINISKVMDTRAALGTLAFVELSEDGDNNSDKTWEARLLETSRTELEASKTTKGREQTNSLTRILYRVLYFIDIHIWEPLCTGARFLHLTVIFVPVLLAVPVMWVGRKQSDRDNERVGALWWYAFLVQAMEWAGPAFIKLGQWAASRTDIFPTQMCDVMSKLHSHAPAHSMHETRKIIEAAFGGQKFEDIFSEFDERPLGVGAIAQVYKAKLRPDLAIPSDADLEREPWNLRQDVVRNVQHILKQTPQRVPSHSVAVKVLHPRVEKIVRRDLRIMGFFARVLDIIPSIEWLSLPDEVGQFGDMMKLQLDLRIEAANLARFRKHFKDRTTAWFPYPYPELTTRNVLVEEFANGIPLSAFLDYGGGVFSTDIADEGLDAFLRMLLLDNFVHADLHPGNIMPPNDATELVRSRLEPHLRNKDPESWRAELQRLEREGYRPQLIFIDAGLVTELNNTNRQNFLDLFRAVAEFDGYKAGNLMCERCRQPDAVIDKEVFALKMQHLVLDVKGRTLALGNIKLGDILHHSEVITLNPLVLGHKPIPAPRNAAADEFYSTWYEITERIQYIPGTGKMGSGKISFNGCFHDMPWGLQTHIYAPMSIELRNKYRIAGNQPGVEPPEPLEIGMSELGVPSDGLYLREDIEIRCNIAVVSFVKAQLKAASKRCPPPWVRAIIRLSLPQLYHQRTGSTAHSVTQQAAPVEMPGDYYHPQMSPGFSHHPNRDSQQSRISRASTQGVNPLWGHRHEPSYDGSFQPPQAGFTSSGLDHQGVTAELSSHKEADEGQPSKGQYEYNYNPQDYRNVRT
ncbi:unnamed protein product [Parascedosporium putredinis]|uniref:Tyrosinase copper-binding domain-containing protein n=1 Tax=Parascedosporium putredinis TaxID=1442378 RepID=A0A9P1GXI3_9PEZI|nr:unnamed protein product [Parascedosporium putredinis]CAI7989041.1 unnamed protein product [Parascedosporium putredinis]